MWAMSWRVTDGERIGSPAATRATARRISAGGVSFSGKPLIVAIVVGPGTAGPAGPVSRFPEIRVARTVENGLYLAVLVLWVPLALALSHSLRRTRPASALFGSALNIFGLAVLAAGAIPHVVTSRLSDL
jgi:hypothetical protein